MSQSISNKNNNNNSNKRSVPSRGKTLVYVPNISEPPEIEVKPKSAVAVLPEPDTILPKPAATTLPKSTVIMPKPAAVLSEPSVLQQQEPPSKPAAKELTGFKIPKLVKRDQPVKSPAKNLKQKKSEEAVKAVKKAIKHSNHETKKPTKQITVKTTDLSKTQAKEIEKQKTKSDQNKTSTMVHSHVTRSTVPKPNPTQQPPPPSNPIASLLNGIDSVHAKESTESTVNKRVPSPQSPISKPLTLKQLRAKRLEYHKKNECNYPMHDSLAFLVDENIKTLGKHCGGLDMKLLASQIQKTDDPLCLSQLKEAELTELCKLMSRNSGRINKYSLFGLDSFNSRPSPMNVDEIMKKFGKNADLLKKGEPLEFANDAELDQFLKAVLPQLTLLDSFAIYEHFIEKLSSPFRKITLFYDNKLKTENMRIQFANNRLIESTDYSYEACVKYICHKNKYDIPINALIHENVVQEDEPIVDESLNDVVQVKKLLNDDELFDKMKMQKVMDNIERNYDGPVRGNQNRWNENHVDRLGYPVRDESRSNYRNEILNDPLKANPNTYERPRFEKFDSTIISKQNRGQMRRAKDYAPLDEAEYKRRIEDKKTDINFEEIYKKI